MSAVPSASISAPRRALDRPVVLVGLMGAGKTAIGRRLAARLGMPFVDADHEIERAAGMTVTEIFLQMGEPAFRDGERRVIARLLERPPTVIATGGGAFIDDKTRAAVKAVAISIWLRADLDLLVKRTAKGDKRPLLKTGDPREILAELMERRHPYYAEADLVVDSLDAPPERMVDRVIQALVAYVDGERT